MPYRDTNFQNGNYYHIYNRGVEGRDLFMDEEDGTSFLNLLNIYVGERKRGRSAGDMGPKRTSHRDAVNITAYILMPNHFHMLLRQEKTDGITKLMRSLLTAYAMYFNKKYDRTGTLFQGRFKSRAVSNDEELTILSKFIHQNATDLLGKSQRLIDYPYSSLQQYADTITVANETVPQIKVDKDKISGYFINTDSNLTYQTYTERPLEKDEIERFKTLFIDV